MQRLPDGLRGKLVLRFEMAVDRAMGEARSFRQRIDADAFEPAFAKQLCRGGNDLLAVLGRLFLRDAHA